MLPHQQYHADKLLHLLLREARRFVLRLPVRFSFGSPLVLVACHFQLAGFAAHCSLIEEGVAHLRQRYVTKHLHASAMLRDFPVSVRRPYGA